MAGRDDEELPGRVSKAEQDRLKRERHLEQQREWNRRNADAEARRKRDSRRNWASTGAPESPELRARRAARDRERNRNREPRPPAERPLGQNEQRVKVYLRDHPNATPKDIAFYAIYGGGSTAWEGLHRKTRSNASAEASRVMRRLQEKGEVRIAGYTLGGKPKYVTREHAEPKKAEEKRDALGRKIKPKKGGGDAPAEDKGSLGVWSAPGSKGGDDSGGSSGGGAGSVLGGGIEGLIGGGGSSSDDSGDDDGPRDGKLW